MCFAIVNEQHPGHGFVRVSDAASLVHYHATRDTTVRPQHHATCNSCEEVIYGVRYKCMHPMCDDYDLCARCEALPIPVHPASHPLLKLRTPDVLIPDVKRFSDPRPEPSNATVPSASPPAPRLPSPASFLPTVSLGSAEVCISYVPMGIETDGNCRSDSHLLKVWNRFRCPEH
jgi:next to BRCA1 gene 1 protein